MNHMEKLKRYIIFFLGLLVNSVGVSLVTKAELGTSPISSIPYVLSLNLPLSLGAFTVLFSLLLILLQLLILRKDFKLEHVLQIPVSLAFGVFIDVSMSLLGFVHPEAYIIKILYLLLGCLTLGIGVYMEVLANVVMLPGESFVRAVVFRWKKEFGLTKIAFDVTMTVVAVALSFVFAGKLLGVREGTIIAAILVGFIARLIRRKLSFLSDKLFPDKERKEEKSSENESQSRLCIAIGRQYGSGGHDIGKNLAKELAFEFYDRDIIQLAAGTTGYTPEFIQGHEEQLSNSFLHDLVNQMYEYFPEEKPPEDVIFEAEKKVVLDAIQEKNCVIVGRCADVILKDQAKCLRIFLCAPPEYRIKRIMETEGLTETDAKKKMRHIDRRRAEYYRYYTHQIWGMSVGHHICIDTSLGAQEIEKMILDALVTYFPEAKNYVKSVE